MSKQYTERELQAIIDAFLDGHAVDVPIGCPLFFKDGNASNLWFQGNERVNPALLGVRTFDGAINYRESKTEGSITPKNGVYGVNRGDLKDYLIRKARTKGLTTTAVFKLTVQKANQTTLQRALNFGELDFSL